MSKSLLLNFPLLPSHVHQQGAGLEAEHQGLRPALIRDVGVTMVLLVMPQHQSQNSYFKNQLRHRQKERKGENSHPWVTPQCSQRPQRSQGTGTPFRLPPWVAAFQAQYQKPEPAIQPGPLLQKWSHNCKRNALP